MRVALLLTLAFFTCAPLVVALTPIDARAMDATVTITDDVRLAPDGPGYRMDRVSGTLVWYPRESSLMDVPDISFSPEPSIETDGLRFTWTDPDEIERLRVTAHVRTRNAIVPVRERIPFPLQDVPQGMEAYLAYGEFTDTSASIQRQAQALAAGKTDAYEVVFALADWTTTNVEYSLDSLRAPAIQRSSQVMATRQGKCDELTALFISMNRALGIPARFVAGYSYTDSDQFADVWGGHGWAEVWLPDAGWVPFDVTYGEYGYLDAGHIPMSMSADAQETSVTYDARGLDFRLETSPLDIEITPTLLEPRDNGMGVRVTLDAPHANVGFGSTVLIIATLANERDHYVSTRLDLAPTRDTALLSDTYANVLLRPGETRKIPFLVRIDDDLDNRYRYAFPFVLRTRLGAEASVTVDVTADGPVYEPSDFASEIDGSRPDGAVPEFGVVCDRGPARYVGETVLHACTAIGTAAGELSVCAGSDCARLPVDDGAFALPVVADHAGTHTIAYVARDATARTATFYVTTRAVEPTVMTIVVDAPTNAQPGDAIPLAATISATGATALNLTITVGTSRGESSENLERLRGNAELRFSVPGRVLRPGQNAVAVTVRFTDEVGTERVETQTTLIELTDVGLFDRIVFWVDDAGAWIEGLFS